MRRQVLGVIGSLLVAATLHAATGAQILLEARDLKNQPLAAAGTRILLIARDNENHPLSGFRFAYQGVESKATNQTGATELDLPPDHTPGKQIKVQLVPGSKRTEDWFLVNPQVNIPASSASAELVLMRRSTFRQIAAAARDTPGELTLEDRKQVLIEEAAHHGLTPAQLELAISSFAETQDSKDRGIAAFVQGQLPQAKALLSKAAEKEEGGLLETLRYLGATCHQQANYKAAADSFRKALALNGDDPALLSWLGETLHELGQWTEAESLMRRALALDEKSLGAEHISVARDLNELALLLQNMDRLSEAEPLMRRALNIDELRFGADHPNVAIDLSNLGQLLQDMNQLTDAEQLMRRALAIDEKRLGTWHSRVARDLGNLAQLLQATNRLGEAEPLMRRAIAIAEKCCGADHPRVAILLNNLAGLLQATNRLAEAEALLRRALAIDEKGLGAEHPKVAIDLNNLAGLLQATSRSAEAESLMRRALAIGEKSLGAEHPNLVLYLNNLAQILQAENRLSEAEPLMKRAVEILLELKRRTGHEQPSQIEEIGHYRELLQKLGKPEPEIEATIEALAKTLR